MVSTRKKFFCGVIFIIGFSSVSLESVDNTTAKVEALTPNRDKTTPGVASRFFDFGNILGSLFGPNRGSPENNVFQPAVAIQGPLRQQGGRNPSTPDQRRFPNQGRYPSQDRFQNFDQGRYPNIGPIQGGFANGQNQGTTFGLQGQGQIPNQGGFGNGLNQGQNFNMHNQGQFPNQGGFGNSQNQGQIFNTQDQGQFPTQQGFGNGQNQAQNFEMQDQATQGRHENGQNQGENFDQQYPERGTNQGQGQIANEGVINPDELPNQVNLDDHGTIYDPELHIENTSQRPNPGGQNHLGQSQWQNQNPTQTQGIQRPNQRPNWLDIGQGIYPRPGVSNGAVNPSQNFGNQGTQTDEVSPIDFNVNGQNGQGINNFPTAGNNNSTTTGRANNNSTTFDDSQTSTIASPTLTQCVQDCSSTSEYNPVCGSNNVTYFNGGKFICARNCGLDIYIFRKGRCPEDVRRGISGMTSRSLNSMVDRIRSPTPRRRAHNHNKLSYPPAKVASREF